MLVQKIDHAKLVRLIDAADAAYAAMRVVSDRFEEKRRRRSAVRVKVNQDEAHYKCAVPGAAQELQRLDEEIATLNAKKERLTAVWQRKKAIASACEEFAMGHAGYQRSDSGILVGDAV